MQGQLGPGSEQLLQLLVQDNGFARAVQQQDTQAAAAAAIAVVKANFKAFAATLRPPGSSFGLAGAPGGGSDACGSPTLRRLGSEQQQLAARRSSDPGLPARQEIRVKDRVVINTHLKKFEGSLMGREGVVMHITPNGWVKLQVGSDTVDVQMRHLTLVQPGGLLGSRGGAGAGRGGGTLRRSEVVKAVRKELTQLEEQVPWKEVQDRWRTLRKSWTRKLRQADSPRDVALCIREFHDNLKTDKGSGLFATGGTWELLLRDCIAGTGNHLQLHQLWDEMQSALQAWLEGQLPGGLANLDKASYAQAVATYQVLQEAAIRGPEYLEQVPLDQILTSHKQLLALQHVIQREAAAAHERLHSLALGSRPGNGPAAAAAPAAAAPAAAAPAAAAPAAAAGAPAAAAGGPAAAPAAAPAASSALLVPPEFEGGLTEGMLLQLGKLPRIKASEGAGSDADTDKDAGSDATDEDAMEF